VKKILVLLVFGIMVAGTLLAQARTENFRQEGMNYIATASGRGGTEAEAQNAARSSAIHVLVVSLNKDRLFEQLLYQNPPINLAFVTLASRLSGDQWLVEVSLTIDDESIRIMYNTSYQTSVLTVLDEVESLFSEAEALADQAKTAEVETDLGTAITLYWQAAEAGASALRLLEPIEDASLMSSSGLRRASDLRVLLAASQTAALAGYNRIMSAESNLARDEAVSTAIGLLDDIETHSRQLEGWLSDRADQLNRVENQTPSSLTALRNELDLKLAMLQDDLLSLQRIGSAIPRALTLETARADIARRTVERQLRFLRTSRLAVQRELTDPAVARAERSQFIKGLLLRQPSRVAALRLYSPIGINPGATTFGLTNTHTFDVDLTSELRIGQPRGAWMRNSLSLDEGLLTIDLADYIKSTSLTQSFSLGYAGAMLWSVGIDWDWLRFVNGDPVTKRVAPRFSLGGLDMDSGRVLWLASLSWELPYADTGDFALINYLNFGLDGSLRFGNFAEFGLNLALRSRQDEFDNYYDSFRYALSLGFRLPPPFLWGLEFTGHLARPTVSGVADPLSSHFFRIFLEYTL